MKRRRKRREGWSVAGDGSWSVAGDWKLKRRDLASPASEASRSGVTGVWSVAIWRHRRLIRRDWASPASESSRLGVETTPASWSVVILFESSWRWIVAKVNRRQRQAESTAATAGEASPVLKKAKRRRRLGLWVSAFKHFWRIWVFSRASEEYLFGSVLMRA